MMSPEFAASSLEKMHGEAERGFGELLKSGRLIALPYKAVIQEGNLWPSIEESIKKYDIDLLVVGTHGIGAARKVLIGSGAEEIFRKAGVPVLTVGPSSGKEPQYELEFKNILFATDFGRSAEREAEYAFSLAQEHYSRLRFVHVIPYPEAYGEDILALEKETLEQILRIAEETNADLIVMGAKARKSLAGNVPHTKAYRVVSGARCPALTVRS
jgi:nucleotide-binding universal stress UspA family protein